MNGEPPRILRIRNLTLSVEHEFGIPLMAVNADKPFARLQAAGGRTGVMAPSQELREGINAHVRELLVWLSGLQTFIRLAGDFL